MEIKINLIETATNLAHSRILNELGLSEEEAELQLYEVTHEDETVYRDGVQKIFDIFYDEYYNELLLCGIDTPVRDGWDESFKKYASEGDEELLITDF